MRRGTRRPVTSCTVAMCMAVGKRVVGGLAHVDVVVGVHRGLLPELASQ